MQWAGTRPMMQPAALPMAEAMKETVAAEATTQRLAEGATMQPAAARTGEQAPDGPIEAPARAMPAEHSPPAGQAVAQSSPGAASSAATASLSFVRASDPATHNFDGDWPALVSRLSSSGVAFELARNCEVRRVEENRFELCLAEKDRQLLPYKDKLKAALEAALGHPVRLTLSVGAIAGATVAAREAQVRKDKQARAAEAIEQDPFVRQLRASFDAKVIEASIKPLD